MMRNKSLVSAAVALMLAACGDGGSLQLATSSGKAVDGYIKDALVLCDTNNNGVADAGEATTVTNATGDFTFSPLCASTIVVSGGTNIDTGLPFNGLLKAPAGSTVATPLTSLMVSGGLTAAQVAAAFGLPAGTDVTTADPAAAGNTDLLKKTLAAQQIMQQTADTLGGLGGNTTPAAIQALYTEVAKAVATTITANPSTPLVASNGTVSDTLVNTVVEQSVTNVASTTNTTLAAVNTAIDAFDASRVAALVSGAIATQAETLATAVSASALTESATTLQASVTVANTATQLSTALNTGDTALLTDVAAALTSNNVAEVIAQASQDLALTVTSPAAPSNYMAINSDSLVFGVGSGSQTNTLAQFKAGNVTLSAQPSTIGFAYTLTGTPIPAGGSQVSVGLEINESSTGRVLQVVLDKVDLTVSGNQLTVNVPAGAKLYAYGKTSQGATANVTLNNDVANQLVTTGGSDLSFNVGNVLDSILAKVEISSPFANLTNVKGTFSMKAVVSNLKVQSEANAIGDVISSSVQVTGSTVSVTGLGVQGSFTVN